MFEKIMSEWTGLLAKQNNSHWMVTLGGADLSAAHYKGYLLETYHYTKWNPQIQAYSSMFFPTGKYNFLSKYLKHAADEISHDNLALNDLVKLGESKDSILKLKPLPITKAFISLPFFHIPFESPLTYLGQIFHLEFLATSRGTFIVEALKKAGIAEEAMSFIKEHAVIDEEHNASMKLYIREMVKTESDYDYFVSGIRTSMDIFFRMIDESFRNGKKIF